VTPSDRHLRGEPPAEPSDGGDFTTISGHLFGYFRERGWTIHMDDRSGQSQDPYLDLARFVGENRPFTHRLTPGRRREDQR
jgi:hypothetical protein